MAHGNERRQGSQPRQSDGLYKRGKVWWMRLMFDGQMYHRSTGSTSKSGAQVFVGRARDDLELKGRGLPPKWWVLDKKLEATKKGTITLREYAPTYMKHSREHKRSWRRDEWCIEQLVEEFGDLPLDEIKADLVSAFVERRLREPVVLKARDGSTRYKYTVVDGKRVPATYSTSTVNRQTALLRAVLTLAKKTGKIDKHPLEDFENKPEEMREASLSREEEEELVAACPPWLAWLVRLALASGCRQAELLNLEWKDVDRDTGALRILETKAGKPRTVEIGDPSVLRELGERRAGADEPVVTIKPGKAPSASGTQAAFKRAAKKIGRPDLVFHSLRHVLASRLLAEGANLPEIADQLGHSRKSMTVSLRYSHVNPKRARDLLAKAATNGNDFDARAIVAGLTDEQKRELLDELHRVMG